MSSFFLVILLLLVILFIGLPVAFSLGTTSLLLVFLFGLPMKVVGSCIRYSSAMRQPIAPRR